MSKLKNPEKIIYEGWTVADFVEELEPSVKMIMAGQSWRDPFKTKEELKIWVGENQPYYKKPVKEVVDYFASKYNIHN